MGRRDDVVSDYACSLALTDDFLRQFLSVAGADSVPNGMDWWTLAMLAYPETQARAQAELDTVVGLPHRTTEDDWYEGMFIPKGTICIANVWLMNRDPEIYGENSGDFDPARYLDAVGDIAPSYRTQRTRATSRTVLAVGSALVCTWPTTLSSSTLRSCSGQPRSNVRRMNRDNRYPWTWMVSSIVVLLCQRTHHTPSCRR